MVNETEPMAESAAQMAIIRSQKITLPSIKINDLSALNKRPISEGSGQKSEWVFEIEPKITKQKEVLT